MKTHLAFDGYRVRWRWRGRPPNDAQFESHGYLVNAKSSVLGAERVCVYHSRTEGYGYEATEPSFDRKAWRKGG